VLLVARHTSSVPTRSSTDLPQELKVKASGWVKSSLSETLRMMFMTTVCRPASFDPRKRTRKERELWELSPAMSGEGESVEEEGGVGVA